MNAFNPKFASLFVSCLALVLVDANAVIAFDKKAESVRSLISQRRYKQAESVISDLLRKDPQQADWHVLHGELLRQTGQLEESADEFARAAELSASNPVPLICLAELSMKQLNQDLSLSYAQQAVARDPSCLPARICLIDTLLQCEQTGEADRQFKCLPAKFHTDYKFELLAYRICLKKGDLFGASNHLRRAIKANPPDSFELKMEESDLLQNMADYESCKSALENMILTNPDSLSCRLRLARLLETQFHDYASALHQYNEAVRLDPLSAPALAGRDRCQRKRRNIALQLKVSLRAFFAELAEHPDIWPKIVF